MAGWHPAAKFLEHLRKQEALGDKAVLPLYEEHREATVSPLHLVCFLLAQPPSSAGSFHVHWLYVGSNPLPGPQRKEIG